MKEFKYIITDAEGIHARPAGLLKKEAAAFNSKILIAKGNKSVEAGKIFGVMGLGVKQGDEVVVTVEGEDEENAITAMEAFFKNNL